MTGNIYPRICVSALSGGGGKTLLALGLVRAFASRGRIVQPFKKGPDFIDAAWLAAAAGRPVTNLDPFFLGPDALRELFARTVASAGLNASQDTGQASGKFQVHCPPWQGTRAAGQTGQGQPVLAVIEGNRGLFDGLDQAGSCSTAHLARSLACPILLCLDCRKVTRTMAAIVRGVTAFEQGLDFAGLILNQTGSPRHESNLRSLLEAHTGLHVLGALPRLAENPLPERHMGLASAGAGLATDVAEKLDAMAALIATNCDLPAIEALAAGAPALPGAFDPAVTSRTKPLGQIHAGAGRPLIGYVRDEVLWFYYPENLQALENAGARLVELAIARDSDKLGQLDGLYLGGGFPEDNCQMLSTAPFVRHLAGMAQAGLPIYAECGGFILLASALTSAGKRWPMAGIFDLEVEFCEKPQGLGYVQAQVTGANPYFASGSKLVGHEFHYSRCCPGKPLPAVLALERGLGMGKSNGSCVDGLVCNNVFASYTHFFAPAVPDWAMNFVQLASQYRQNKENMANESLGDHSGLESF